MPEATLQLRDFVCPQCRSTARLDPRFVQWCSDCGYGADPKPPELTGRAKRRADRERERATGLYESLRKAPNLRPTSAVGVAVTVLATLVHLSSLVLLVLPVYFLATTSSDIWWFALGFAVLTFIAVRPRFFKKSVKASSGIKRERAPKFYALLDRCAAELGCTVPDHIFFDARFNAGTFRAGLRRESVLVIGAPLWTVLSGQQRIALLGHELAHQINGDVSHGTWANAAHRTIFEWTKLLDPRQTNLERSANRRWVGRRGGGAGGLTAVLAPIAMAIVFAPFFLLAAGARMLLMRLDLFCGQRAEYLADELGARLAGSEAAHGMLATLALTEAIHGSMLAMRNRRGQERVGEPDQFWDEIKSYADSIPETERQRRRILDKLRNTRADRTHPANHLRLALVSERPQLPPKFSLDAEDWAAIDAELAGAYAGAGRAYLAAV